MTQSTQPSAAPSATPKTAAETGDTVLSEQFNADGMITHSASMRGGALNGEFHSFGDPDVTLVKAVYMNGQLDGVLTLRDEEGRLLQEANYSRGMQDGVTRVYSAGRLLTEQHYESGKLHGPSLAYGVAGDVSLKQTYANGQLEGDSNSFQEGRVVRRATYRAGLQHGEVVEFNREGNPVQKAIYVDDLLDGTLTRYWPDGAILETQDYKVGKPVSTLQRFDQNGNAVSEDKVKPGFMKRLEQMVKG